MRQVRRRGQITLKAALGLAAGVLTVGGALWGAAASSGADKLRLTMVEEQQKRTDAKVEKLMEMPGQIQGLRDSMDRIETRLIEGEKRKK